MHFSFRLSTGKETYGMMVLVCVFLVMARLYESITGRRNLNKLAR